MQIITIYAFFQFVSGQTRFNENDLVDPNFLDSLKKAQSVFDQENFTKSRFSDLQIIADHSGG